MKEELREIARKCSEILKKGGIVMMPSSAGMLLCSNFLEGPGLEKLLSLAEKINENVVLVTDRDEKLNYLLQDIPNVAFDLIEHSEKPIIINYGLPSQNISKKITGAENTLDVMVVPDEVLSRVCNQGLKAMAALLLGKGQQSKLPLVEAILPEVDYIVTLPDGANPRMQTPSMLVLKMNGEIKIIRK